jgi:hypothetical protein
MVPLNQAETWFESAMMASLSKWKQMAVVLLSDLLAVVKGRMGVARHDDALATALHSLPRLSSHSDGQQLMGPVPRNSNLCTQRL